MEGSIPNRVEFQRVLDETLAMIGDRIRQTPKFQIYEILEVQLDAMWRWTADGRVPLPDECKRINIGTIAVRELEPARSQEDDDFIQNLHKLNFYFSYWPDDPNVAATCPPFWQQ